MKLIDGVGLQMHITKGWESYGVAGLTKSFEQ